MFSHQALGPLKAGLTPGEMLDSQRQARDLHHSWSPIRKACCGGCGRERSMFKMDVKSICSPLECYTTRSNSR